MQMIMIIKIVCAIMKLKMLFSKRGLKVFWQTWWPWKCRKQKHDWKFSGSLLKPTLQLSQQQQSLRWHFKLSDHWTFFFSVIAAIVTTIGNQALVNLNVGLIRIKPVWSLSSLNVSLLFFFYMHILAFQELSVRVCKPWNPVYPWFNAVVKINLLNLLKWTKLLDPSNFYLVWCLFISMARWCWG